MIHRYTTRSEASEAIAHVIFANGVALENGGGTVRLPMHLFKIGKHYYFDAEPICPDGSELDCGFASSSFGTLEYFVLGVRSYVRDVKSRTPLEVNHFLCTYDFAQTFSRSEKTLAFLWSMPSLLYGNFPVLKRAGGVIFNSTRGLDILEANQFLQLYLRK